MSIYTKQCILLLLLLLPLLLLLFCVFFIIFVVFSVICKAEYTNLKKTKIIKN